MLLAHVIEHMDRDSALALIDSYLPYLRPGGKVFFVCPQERGYASDPTHVRFTDGDELEALALDAGLEPDDWFSFPLPRRAGTVFALQRVLPPGSQARRTFESGPSPDGASAPGAPSTSRRASPSARRTEPRAPSRRRARSHR